MNVQNHIIRQMSFLFLGMSYVIATHGSSPWAAAFKRGAREAGVGLASSVADTALLDAQVAVQGELGDDTFEYQLEQCQNLAGVGGLDSQDYQRQCGNLPQMCQQMAYRRPGQPLPPYCMMVLGPMLMQAPMPGPWGTPGPPPYISVGPPQAMAAPIGSIGFVSGMPGVGMMPSPGGMMGPGAYMNGYGMNGYGGYSGAGGGGVSDLGTSKYWEGFAGSQLMNTLSGARRHAAHVTNQPYASTEDDDEDEE